MLGVLAAVPCAAVLALHAQQSPAALPTFFVLLSLIGHCGDAIAGLLLEFGDEGRWA